MKPTPVLLRGRSSALQASAVLAVALYGSLAAAQTANITPITVPDATSVSLSALNRHGHAVAAEKTAAFLLERGLAPASPR